MATPTSAPPAPPPPRPLVLIVCHALTGHLEPLIRISAGLCARGWPVTFLGPTVHRARIEASGAAFAPHTGAADLDDRRYYADPPTGADHYAALSWVERGKIDVRAQLLDPLPAQWADVKAALAALHVRAAADPDPARQVLVVAEAFFLGLLPLKYGADPGPDIPPPRTLCVSVTVPALRSVDLPPFAWPLPFDPSPAGRARNARAWDRWAEHAAGLTELLDRQMRAAGAVQPLTEPFLAGANYRCHDRILQLGVPGFEYPRSDWPANIRFAGLVQRPPKTGAAAPAAEPPFSWWPEIRQNSAISKGDPRRKRVVVVAQGTVETNPHDLIIPTIEAFAERADVLVVAILGWKDARLADAIKVPSNARVADYLSYDAILQHSDVWVHNAGFGAVNHGIAHGVPMVVGGEGMDKTENARRVAWSGIGVDLESARPSNDDVRDGVEAVLQDPKYTERVGALRRQSEEIDCFDTIHEELLKLADIQYRAG